MASNKRTFTDQQNIDSVAQCTALRASEHLTIDAYAAKRGLSAHTFSDWLSEKKRYGTSHAPLVTVGCQAPAPAEAHDMQQVRIAYVGAVIKTDLASLSAVLTPLVHASGTVEGRKRIYGMFLVWSPVAQDRLARSSSSFATSICQGSRDSHCASGEQ